MTFLTTAITQKFLNPIHEHLMNLEVPYWGAPDIEKSSSIDLASVLSLGVTNEFVGEGVRGVQGADPLS
jgi:hypothetical protein